MAIKSFKDLDVFQNAYQSALSVMLDIIPHLPVSEKYSLVDQLRRSSKAIPALIAEGFAKKHLPKAFQKYLVDAMGECNEVVVHLSYCRDLYQKNLSRDLCSQLITQYDIIGKQLYRLNIAWQSFRAQARISETKDQTHFQQPSTK